MPSDPRLQVRMVAETNGTHDRAPGYLARSFGLAIARERYAAGKSQRGQAAELGIAGNTLRGIEHGEDNPTLARIEELAAKLGLEVTIRVRKARR